MRRLRGLAVGICVLAAIGIAAIAWTRGTDAPVQPIDFSHRAHEVADKLDCEYCHSTARRAALAGIPAVERCIGCHRYVATSHPEVVKLVRYWDRRIPIVWTAVSRLPRFVRFSHEAHVRASVSCEHCHGAIEQMDRVPVREFSMGWCVTCHRDRGATVDCLTCHY